MFRPENKSRNIQTSSSVQNILSSHVPPSPRDVLTGRSADLRGDQTLEKDVRCALPVGPGAARSDAALIRPAAADRDSRALKSASACRDNSWN